MLCESAENTKTKIVTKSMLAHDITGNIQVIQHSVEEGKILYKRGKEEC